jgi:ComEC/Rec2-related protein
LIAGLAIPFVNPWVAVIGLVLVASYPLPVPRALIFTALGIVLTLHLQLRDAQERAAFSQLHPDRFVTIEAPLERDWMHRDDSFVLRTSRFTANGVAFEQPLAIYARFEPPEIAMDSSLRAEGFLREGEFGGYTLTIKSAELMSYAGELSRWHPAAWNRALANRLEPHSRERPDEVALAHALILGRGERLTESMRASFRRGGTYHLLVFSGLQIALAAALIAWLLRRFHAPRASDWLLLAFAVLAPLFIGPTASVSRASVGIGLYALSRLLKRPTSIENLWCVAALARLILEPRDLTDASFHLTYAGAGALIFIGKHFRKPFGIDLHRDVSRTTTRDRRCARATRPERSSDHPLVLATQRRSPDGHILRRRPGRRDRDSFRQQHDPRRRRTRRAHPPAPRRPRHPAHRRGDPLARASRSLRRPGRGASELRRRRGPHHTAAFPP